MSSRLNYACNMAKKPTNPYASAPMYLMYRGNITMPISVTYNLTGAVGKDVMLKAQRCNVLLDRPASSLPIKSNKILRLKIFSYV
jgi:hypothetical protein